MDLSGVPWYAWFALIAMVPAAIGLIINAIASARGNTALKQQLEENAALNRKLLERLDTLDSRVGGVEKTLNDIPG